MVKGIKRNPVTPTNYDIHNRFDIEVIDAKTGVVKQKARAFNVICNTFWNSYFLSQSSWFYYIHYGDGTGTPSANDTTLFNFLAAKSCYGLVTQSNFEQNWVSFRQQIKITETEAVGKTLTEVGVGAKTSATSLCTHAMLQDMNGNQISIVKTSTDIINIYATIFVHFPLNSFGFFRSDGYPSEFAYYLAGIRSPSGKYFRLLPIMDDPQYNVNSSDMFTVDSTNKKATWTAGRLSADAGNSLGGIVSAYAFEGIMMSFMDDWYSATKIIGESLGVGDGVTTDFATDFYGCKNATVYVNGIAQTSGVTILENQPISLGSSRDATKFFLPVTPNGRFGFCRTDGFGRYFLDPNQQLIIKNSLFGVITPETLHSDVGVPYCLTEGSNDLLAWTTVSRTSPGDYLYYRWSMSSSASSGGYCTVKCTSMNLTNVRFTSPPVEGDIITIDYTPKCLAKDSNHVFDFSLEMNFGEYTQ